MGRGITRDGLQQKNLTTCKNVLQERISWLSLCNCLYQTVWKNFPTKDKGQYLNTKDYKFLSINLKHGATRIYISGTGTSGFPERKNVLM